MPARLGSVVSGSGAEPGGLVARTERCGQRSGSATCFHTLQWSGGAWLPAAAGADQGMIDALVCALGDTPVVRPLTDCRDR
jgi:hypothetical protein